MDFTPPGPLDFSSDNLSEHWKIFKEELDIYLTASEKSGKSDEIKTCILLSCVGKQGRQIYNNFTYAPTEVSKNFDTVLQKFDEYCNPRKNVTLFRFKFLTARQEEAQTFDDFVTKLKTLSHECELMGLRDSLIRDLIIIGTNDVRLQEKLLAQTDLTLDKAVNAGRTAEITRHSAEMLQKELKSVHFTRKQSSKHKNNNYQQSTRSEKHNRSSTSKEKIKDCRFCSFSHFRGNCPAYNQTCNKCHRRNHFASRCPSNKSVHKVDQEDSEFSSSDDEKYNFSIDCISANSSPTDRKDFNNYKVDATSMDWTVNLNVNRTKIDFKIDSGSQINILPMKEYIKLLDRPKLKPTGITLSAYNNTAIPVQGKCITQILHKNTKYNVRFIVADIDAPPLIGLQSCKDLNLIQRVCKVDANKPNYLSTFKDCFGELGALPGTHHITMDPQIKPIINPPRNLPFALKDKLKDELERMTQLGVIVPVTEPTEWVSSLVVVEKPNGSLRVFLDPRNLNKAIKREHYRLPTATDIIHEMSGAKFFTKLDASNAFWQIQVDDESSKLLTFNSPCGRYRFTRLPYGIHSASEICHAKIASIIENIEGCKNSQDDIIIWADTLELMKSRTIEVLQAIRKSGMKLNLSKCQFNRNEITFLGHKITDKGVEPDPRKSKAICDMPEPSNKKELQRFLGMITYLGKFIPNLSNETAPLRLLLEKDTLWSFDKPQKDAIRALKNLVTQSPTLQYFNPKLPIRVSSDASTLGLGAMLEQKHNNEWLPVAYASRSLTSAETNYCPLELEMLSILFACEHFYEYVYGQHFLVQNDHKPLKSIFTKPINKAPPRIQRFLLRLQKYDFDMEYTQGKLMFVADTLSRAALKDTHPEIPDVEMKFHVHSIVRSLPISEKRLEQFRAETANDRILNKLERQVSEGWSEHRQNIDSCLSPYFNYRSEITCYDGLLLKGQQIVVPSSMRTEMRKSLHQAHQGIEKTKSMARQALFWPTMNAEITDMIQNCDSCQQHRNRQTAEPLMQHDVPDQPWYKVGTDLFNLLGKTYLMVVDYHSKYFEISTLADTTASTVVQRTKNIFSKHGIPKLVFSDNGPEYSSRVYKQFANDWDFVHNTSSPEFAQSNGLVERTIQTVKKTLRKCFKSGNDPHLALLTLRATPGKDDTPSPAALLMNRELRTTLPTITQPNNKRSVERHSGKQNNCQRKGGRELPPLNIGDHVRTHDGKSWSRVGRVLSRCQQPRSYLVLMENGKQIRRNRRHLLRVPTTRVPPAHPYPDAILNRPQQTCVSETTNRNPVSRTRSGRVTRPPQWLANYQC